MATLHLRSPGGQTFLLATTGGVVDPEPTIPAAPSTLVATAIDDDSIGLTWTNPATDETSVVVERSPDGSTGWATVATLAANATSRTDGALTAATAYHYRVKNVNAAGSSAYSNTATATTDAAPEPGGELAALDLLNHGGSTLAGTEARFAHVFARGDVPTGHRPVLTVGATTIPHTAARVNTWDDGSLRIADFLCRVPSSVSIAAGASATVSIAAEAGSISTTLPNGKTAADIVADIGTNHATIGVRLTGLTGTSGLNGSGTWQADSTAAFAATGTTGGYRVTATGPTACDLVCWRKLADATGGAAHANLWAQFYITAFLHPTTGAVESLCWRAWINQGYRNVANDQYHYGLELRLGSTTVRSWGLAGDGRAFDFATTDVSAAADTITHAAHGFLAGEMVKFTTTGTLPAPLVAGTKYWARRASSTTFKVYSNQKAADVGQSSIDLTTVGTGTHTVTGRVCHVQFQRHCLAGTDGLWDWHAGTSGVLGTRTVYPLHDATYYRASRMAPPMDLSIDLVHPTESAPQSALPGTNGTMNVSYGDPGAREDVGAVWNDWAARAYRYRNDRAGYVRTARVHALAMGSDPLHFVRDDSTFRIPVLNAGTYSGLGAALPGTYLYNADVRSADVPAPTGGTNSYSGDDASHHSHAVYPVYVFEGGGDLLDLQCSISNFWLMMRIDANPYISSRKQSFGGRDYYSILPANEGQPRAAHWSLSSMADAVSIAPDGTAEADYLGDALRDSVDLADYYINTLGTASFRAAGGWDFEDVQLRYPGVAYFGNGDHTADFMVCYGAMAWAHAFARFPADAALGRVAQQFATYFGHKWVDFPCKAYNVSYHIRTKAGPGASYVDHSAWQDWGFLDSGSDPDGSSGGLSFATSGVITLNANSSGQPQIPVKAGDRVLLTTYDQVANTPGGPAPPSPFVTDVWYYARQVASDGFSFKLATTASDSTIVVPSTTASLVGHWLDAQNRTGTCPTTTYRHHGGVSVPRSGYLTLNRAACGYLESVGLLDPSAFAAADALFALETADGTGPGGFASGDSIYNSYADPSA